MKEEGYKGKTGPKRGVSRGHSTFGNWLRENPDLKLKTTSPSKLAKMSGCTQSAVKNYFYHERKKARNILKLRPWNREGTVKLWTDLRGARIPDRAFKEVYPAISATGRIKFIIRLKSGGPPRIFYMTSHELEELYEIT